MKPCPAPSIPISEFLGCFGEYRSAHPICRQQCILSLRCAIEREQNSRFELIQELLSIENASSRPQ